MWSGCLADGLPANRTAGGNGGGSADWLRLLRLYLALALVLNLAWEAGQLPLYSLWRTANAAELAWAVAHCLAGDLLIATATLVVALLVAGTGGWPTEARNFRQVGLVATLLGIGYTIFSEWLNVAVRNAWAYSPAMPVIPGLDTGLSPLLQWILVPPAALFGARRLALRTSARGGAA
jgi:hypothetical protein